MGSLLNEHMNQAINPSVKAEPKTLNIDPSQSRKMSIKALKKENSCMENTLKVFFNEPLWAADEYFMRVTKH